MKKQTALVKALNEAFSEAFAELLKYHSDESFWSEVYALLDEDLEASIYFTEAGIAEITLYDGGVEQRYSQSFITALKNATAIWNPEDPSSRDARVKDILKCAELLKRLATKVASTPLNKGECSLQKGSKFK